MIPFLYEIRRVLTSKAMVLLVAVIVGLPVLISVGSATSSGGNFVYIESYAFADGNNGSYSVTVFLFNEEYGTPVQGTTVNFTAGSNKTSVITDVNGYANVTFNNVPTSIVGNQPDGDLSNITYEYSQAQGSFSPLYNFTGGVPVYQKRMDPYFSVNTYQSISNDSKVVNTTEYFPRISFGYNSFSVQGHHSLRTVGVMSSLGGTNRSAQFSVYYKKLANASTDGQSPGGPVIINYDSGEVYYSNLSDRSILGLSYKTGSYYYNESQLNFFASVSTAPLTVLNTVNLTTHTNSTKYLFELFTPNGTEMAWAIVQLYTPATTSYVNNLFYNSILPIMGLFVPLMALLSSYTTFGRDRVSGPLNYVVVRPISRKSIITSRFLANVLGVFTPAAASIGISSVVFDYFLGTYIPQSTILLSLWAIVVMAAGFSGLIYLGSVLFRSNGRLIGLLVGIFLTLDLFWSFPDFAILPSIAASLYQQGSLSYAMAFISSYYATPSGYANLVSMLASGSTSVGFFYIGNFKPSQVGVTTTLVVGLGLVWMLVPFVLALIKFSRYD